MSHPSFKDFILENARAHEHEFITELSALNCFCPVLIQMASDGTLFDWGKRPDPMDSCNLIPQAVQSYYDALSDYFSEEARIRERGTHNLKRIVHDHYFEDFLRVWDQSARFLFKDCSAFRIPENCQQFSIFDATFTIQVLVGNRENLIDLILNRHLREITSIQKQHDTSKFEALLPDEIKLLLQKKPLPNFTLEEKNKITEILQGIGVTKNDQIKILYSAIPKHFQKWGVGKAIADIVETDRSTVSKILHR